MSIRLDIQELELIENCTKGNKRAWNLFVKKYSQLIYDCIHKIFRAKQFVYTNDDVEDLFQHIFIKLLENNCRRLNMFEGKNGCSLSTWVRTITIRLALDFMKSYKKFQSLDDHNDDSPPLIDMIKDERELPYEKLEMEELELLKEKVISKLSGQDRLFLTLYYEKELPPEEIAGIMNLSVNSIYSRKSRLKEKFDIILKEFEIN